MAAMLSLSLAVNCLIVFPLTYLMLLAKPQNMEEVYGADTDARRILASVYFAIGVVSAIGLALLLLHATTPDNTAAVDSGSDGNENNKDGTRDYFEMALSLAVPMFWLQIVYKATTAFSVGLQSPVVITNLGVVILHLITLQVNGKLF